jgi:hypothetical protein
MKELNKHIVEYYQENKYLGQQAFNGHLDESKVCYTNREILEDFEVKLKKKYKASKEKPIVLIRYNLYGNNN